MQKDRRLSELPFGASARIKCLMLCGSMRRRLLDVGMTPGVKISCVGISPLGDPRLFLVRGVRIAIRRADADCVIIE